MRIPGALGVVAVTMAAAVYIHQRLVLVSADYFNGSSTYAHPSWEDPVAVLVAVGGLAVAAAILTVRRKRFANPS